MLIIGQRCLGYSALYLQELMLKSKIVGCFIPMRINTRVSMVITYMSCGSASQSNGRIEQQSASMPLLEIGTILSQTLKARIQIRWKI
jgi:hypothetical protein